MSKIKEKQEKGLHRNTIDKYYTKNEIAKQCMEFVKSYLPNMQNDIIIEPSAGNGAFIPYIKDISNELYLYDIEPEHPEIIKKDYLTLNISMFTPFRIQDGVINHSNPSKQIHIIGNPPFGRQSSMAIKFIKKSCEFANSISFILPKSFKKDSLKKSFSLNYHLIFQFDIPDNSFLVDSVEHNVPCIFQIWQKKYILREIEEKQLPQGFTFVSISNNPDISFRRVGVNAGKISKQIHEKSIQSHYFIKFTNNKSIDENIANISKIIFDFNNTVGPKSISKQELIKEFIKVL